MSTKKTTVPVAEVANDNFTAVLRYWVKNTLTETKIVWDKVPYPSQLVGKIAQHLYKLAIAKNISKLEIAVLFSESYCGLKETGTFTVKNMKVLQTCLPSVTEQMMLIFSNEMVYEDSHDALLAGGVNQFQDQMMERIGGEELVGAPTASKVDGIKDWGKALQQVNNIHKPAVERFANTWRAKLGLPSIAEQKQLEKMQREERKLLEAAAPVAK